MSSTQLRSSPISLMCKVFNVLRLVAGIAVRFILKKIHGKGGVEIPIITDDILKQPAIEVARRIRHKEITSVEVLETCIRRIKDVNSALNCFIEDRFELAKKEASDADDLIRGGTKTPEQLEKEKPFLGVPFTTKDCMKVTGLHQTSGMVRRKNIVSDRDADVIKLVRASGAIIIGLTNVPELCMWWESYNHIYGRTRNPYNTTRIVGGSSGGEGAIQAAAGSIFGIGSDIGGSIRMPAFFNGIFGHKPSKFIISNDGQYPLPDSELLNSFLGIGPMTRHAVDLKPLLGVMAGDNSSKLNLDKPVNFSKIRVYYQFCNNAKFTDSVDPDITTAMKRVVEYLTLQHKINAEEKTIDSLQQSMHIWLTTMKDKTTFEERLMEKKVGLVALIWELLKSVIGLSAHTSIALITALTDRYGPQYGSVEYKRCLKKRDDLEKTITDMLGDNGIFLYPTHPTPALYHNEPLVKPFNFSYTAIINCLGLPSTTIPLGLGREGLPIGIQVVANHNNDRLCLAVAEDLDKAFGGWVEPKKS